MKRIIQIKTLENIRNRMKFAWNNQDFANEVNRLEECLTDVDQSTDWAENWVKTIQEQIQISRSLDKIFDEKFEGIDLERIMGFDENKRRWQIICDELCNSIDILTELMKDEMFEQSQCEANDEDNAFCCCECDECDCDEDDLECNCADAEGVCSDCKHKNYCGWADNSDGENEFADIPTGSIGENQGKVVMSELKKIGTDLKDAVGTACKDFSKKFPADAPVCNEALNSLKKSAKKGVKRAERGIRKAINTGIGAFDKWRLEDDEDDDK